MWVFLSSPSGIWTLVILDTRPIWKEASRWFQLLRFFSWGLRQFIPAMFHPRAWSQNLRVQQNLYKFDMVNYTAIDNQRMSMRETSEGIWRQTFNQNVPFPPISLPKAGPFSVCSALYHTSAICKKRRATTSLPFVSIGKRCPGSQCGLHSTPLQPSQISCAVYKLNSCTQ